MARNELVSGNKEKLLEKIAALRPIYGRRWRKMLRQHNDWHKTDVALNAWRNINGGNTGNDSLLQILSDMEAIAAQASPEAPLAPDPKLREKLISDSLKNLKRSTKIKKVKSNHLVK